MRREANRPVSAPSLPHPAVPAAAKRAGCWEQSRPKRGQALEAPRGARSRQASPKSCRAFPRSLGCHSLAFASEDKLSRRGQRPGFAGLGLHSGPQASQPPPPATRLHRRRGDAVSTGYWTRDGRDLDKRHHQAQPRDGRATIRPERPRTTQIGRHRGHGRHGLRNQVHRPLPSLSRRPSSFCPVQSPTPHPPVVHRSWSLQRPELNTEFLICKVLYGARVVTSQLSRVASSDRAAPPRSSSKRAPGSIERGWVGTGPESEPRTRGCRNSMGHHVAENGWEANDFTLPPFGTECSLVSALVGRRPMTPRVNDDG